MNEDIQRDVARECQADLDSAYRKYLLQETRPEEMFSHDHATRWRAKERQAFIMYVNGIIMGIQVEHLTPERVSAIKETAIQTWNI